MFRSRDIHGSDVGGREDIPIDAQKFGDPGKPTGE
jgi:hypothetical protein